MEKIELEAISVVDTDEYEKVLSRCVDDDDAVVNACDFDYIYEGPFPKHDLSTDFSKLLPDGSDIITDIELTPFFAYSVFVRYGNQVVRILCDPDHESDTVTTENDSVRILTGTMVRSLRDAAEVIQRNNLNV